MASRLSRSISPCICNELLDLCCLAEPHDASFPSSSCCPQPRSLAFRRSLLRFIVREAFQGFVGYKMDGIHLHILHGLRLYIFYTFLLLRNRGITYNGIERISKMPSSCWIQHATSLTFLTYAMAPGQRGSLVLLILLLGLICMPQIYACVPTCRKEFKKSFSLVQHKQSCTAALEIRKKSQQIRKDKGDDAFPRETSPFGRKQRLKVGIVSLCYVKISYLHYLHRPQSRTRIPKNPQHHLFP